ncbi:MAG: hypothetical protein LAO76_25205 [Acidobacteriia bacterium]|nr:hypothetical protein [Terriglobia bacterium]
MRSFCIRSASIRHFTMVAYSSFSFSAFRTGGISAVFCFFATVFFAEGLRKDWDFALELLPLCFLAMATDLFFFLRGMGKREPFYRMRTLSFVEMIPLSPSRKFVSNNSYLFSTIR